ncbi:hypothetical protein J6590_049193 [Homalodisca vitripennis]|nr:hypothetical protein J6590_049193 [Homalodisca vitripennis]
MVFVYKHRSIFAFAFVALDGVSIIGGPCWREGIFMFAVQPKVEIQEQIGAAEACWAHNPEVRGSKPRSAITFLATRN